MSNKCALKNLQEFMEDEARSGAMDFACITPLYVYRMWGGSSGYRRYCHRDGRGKKDEVRKLLRIWIQNL